MAKDLSVILTEINTLLPDNQTRQISPQDVRDRLVDIHAWLESLDGGASTTSWKTSVRCATNVNTSIATAPAVIDGVTMAADQRVLLTGQTTTTENGIWVWAATAAPMTRPTDFATGSQAASATVAVDEGTSAESSYRQTEQGVVDTVAQTWIVDPATDTNVTTGVITAATANRSIDLGTFDLDFIQVDSFGVSAATDVSMTSPIMAMRGTQPVARFYDSTDTFFTGIRGPGTGTNVVITLPGALPASDGQLLSATTAGVTSWVSPSSDPANLGVFADMAALQLAHATATAGDFAQLTKGGVDASWAIWDTGQSAWIDTSSVSGATDLAADNITSTTVDVTSSTGTDATIPAATITTAGLMTAADKVVLDNAGTDLAVDSRGSNTLDISSSTGANVTVPAATTSLAGLLTGADKTILDNSAANLAIGTRDGVTLQVTSSTGTDVNIPMATSSLAGAMSAADKTTLDNSAANLAIGTNDATTLQVTSSTGTDVNIPMAGANAGAMSAADKSAVDAIANLTSGTLPVASGARAVDFGTNSLSMSNLTTVTETGSGAMTSTMGSHKFVSAPFTLQATLAANGAAISLAEGTDNGTSTATLSAPDSLAASYDIELPDTLPTEQQDIDGANFLKVSYQGKAEYGTAGSGTTSADVYVEVVDKSSRPTPTTDGFRCRVGTNMLTYVWFNGNWLIDNQAVTLTALQWSGLTEVEQDQIVFLIDQYISFKWSTTSGWVQLK
jgi:hypothetical protein